MILVLNFTVSKRRLKMITSLRESEQNCHDYPHECPKRHSLEGGNRRILTTKTRKGYVDVVINYAQRGSALCTHIAKIMLYFAK